MADTTGTARTVPTIYAALRRAGDDRPTEAVLAEAETLARIERAWAVRTVK